MKRIALVLALSVPACIPQPAAAAYMDGNKLYSYMTSDDGDRRIAAMFFIGGVHDAAQLGDVICSPKNATLGQANDMVKKFITENPQFRAESAASITVAVLSATWPCESKPAKPTKSDRPVKQI